MIPKRDARLPSWSIVIETANLQTADQSDLITSLDSIASQDPSPAEANEVVILDSGEAEPELLKDLLARYPWARVEQIPEGTDYGDQKSLSAEFTTGEVVVFADSDCTYDKGCLASYLETFAQRSDVEIQAGETAILIRGPFTLAMALVYFFPRFSYEREVSPARGFYGNNVAFRRDVLGRVTDVSHWFGADQSLSIGYQFNRSGLRALRSQTGILEIEEAYGYDKDDQLISIWNGSQRPTLYSYDQAGNRSLEESAQGQRVWRQAFHKIHTVGLED
jgi:YD repeat-containing protein